MTEDLKERYESFSESQKRVADYILENDEYAPFLTAAKLAARVGVSESTVVRFAALLGYDGYSEMQAAMVDELQAKLVAPKKYMTNKLKNEPSDVMRKVFVADARNIVDSIHYIDQKVFDMAVELLDSARRIYVVGLRNCAPLAMYLTTYLSMMRPDVSSVTTTDMSEMFEQLSWMDKDDVVVGISFPRYSLRTLKAMDYANSQGGRLICITDSEYSPMNMYSSCNLWAKSDMITMVDSMAAPLSVINALCVALFMKNEENIKHNLERLEEIWDDYMTYDKDALSGREE